MAKVKILDNTTNTVVVQIPGREYPGLVLQGDQLRHLSMMANSDDEFQKMELRQTLAGYEEHYHNVCQRQKR